MFGARSLAFLLPAVQLCRAINVYLSPQFSPLDSRVSPEDASAVLSRHLGVEMFEPFRQVALNYNDDEFIGRGPSNALLVTLDDVDAKAVLPTSLKPSFKVSIPPSTGISTLFSLTSTYFHRARHAYTSTYHANVPTEDSVDAISAFFTSAEAPAFVAADFESLSQLRHSHGQESKEYIHAAGQIRDFLNWAFNTTESLNIAIITYSPLVHQLNSRQAQASQSPLPPSQLPPPQEPIGSISTCHTSAKACKNATNSCSGHGKCMEATKAGRTCFICTCGVTKTGEGSKVKTERWVGQSCERKDVSGPFVLFVGTAIVMVVLLFGSILLLSNVGNQELPSTLLATAINGKKD